MRARVMKIALSDSKDKGSLMLYSVIDRSGLERANNCCQLQLGSFRHLLENFLVNLKMAPKALPSNEISWTSVTS